MPATDSGQPQNDSGPSETGPAQETGVPEAEAGSPSGLIPTMVNFNLVGCGTPAATFPFSVTNTGGVPVTYSATISNSTVFAIQGGNVSNQTVAVGATASITLTATVPATATAGMALTGSITVTTDIPGFTTVTVPLSVTPQGGSITVSPGTAGFGQAQLGSPEATLPLVITNVGNAAVSVSFGTPTDPEFGISYLGGPNPVSVAAGATLSGATASFLPTSVGAKSATAALNTSGTLCASGGNSVGFTGSGTAANVTVGPTPLNFLTVACGAPPPASQAVKITNGSGAAITFTAVLAKGASSPYTIDVPSGTVPANGTMTINVTPSPITLPASVAPNAYGDTLTVTTDADGVPPATIALMESATGALLAISMPTTAFGLVPLNTSANEPFSVINTGNVDAPLALGTFGGDWSAKLTGIPTATANGGKVPGTVTFVPTDATPNGTSLTVTTTAPLCDVIAPVAVTGQGLAPLANITGPNTASATCGGPAPTQLSITITNTGQSNLAISNLTSSSHLQIVSGPATVIPPGGTGDIVFSAITPVIGTTLAGTYGETITFSTNEVGNPSYNYGVTVTINGANLAFNVNPIVITSCGVKQYEVTNTGNQSAQVSANSPYPEGNAIFFDGAFSGLRTIFANSGVTDDIFDEAFNACPAPTVITFSDPTTASNPVCIPLPTLTVDVGNQSGSGCFCGSGE